MTILWLCELSGSSLATSGLELGSFHVGIWVVEVWLRLLSAFLAGQCSRWLLLFGHVLVGGYLICFGLCPEVPLSWAFVSLLLPGRFPGRVLLS